MFSFVTSGSISCASLELEYTENWLQMVLPIHAVAKIEHHCVTFYVYGLAYSM